jgi:hypothetical protein
MRAVIKDEGDVEMYLISALTLTGLRKDVLFVGDRNTDFEVPNSIQDFQSLTHSNEFTRIVQIHERPSELSSLSSAPSSPLSLFSSASPWEARHTLSKRFCQYVSTSLPAASIQVSTAFAKSGRIDRIASSAFGDFASKCSSASYSTEAGCDDPGLNTASEESDISADLSQYGPAHLELSVGNRMLLTILYVGRLPRQRG